MSEVLKQNYPEFNFVPVFWMASEDHDFEEIASVELFNQFINWETDQKGAVGRFQTTGLEELHEQFKSFFQPENRTELEEYLADYEGQDLADATFRSLNYLFQAFGLLIVDGDDPQLKSAFVPVMKKDLTEKFSFHSVQHTNEQLVKEGYKIQVNPREINLFYLSEQSRERILSLEDGYFIEGKGRVEEGELFKELEEAPQNFSPNVVLRPLYQELVLPNLVYVGGVNELNYWMQLKRAFSEAAIVFPMICARTSILYIDSIASKRMNALDMVLENLFMDISHVKQQYLRKYAGDDIQFEPQDEAFIAALELIKEKIVSVDSQLINYAESESTKMLKQYNAVKEKLQRVVKNKHDLSMRQIEQLFERLFPNGNLQERQIGFFTMCSDGKIARRLNQIHDIIDPFDSDFVIVRESK
jgi:bacillithiol biosynthesis cysteine-adding enzyme BshC